MSMMAFVRQGRGTAMGVRALISLRDLICAPVSHADALCSAAPLSAAAPLWRYPSPLLRHFTSLPQGAALDPPLITYDDLRSRADLATPLPAFTKVAGRLAYVLRSFRRSARAKEMALALYISDSLFSEASAEFAKFVQGTLPRAAALALTSLEEAAAHEALFACFADFVLDRHALEMTAYRNTVRSLDLRHPHLWFSMARALHRRVIYHAGPTNSGKTYTALTAMRSAKSGAYCGPLRLLAMEVYDTCNADGTDCSLVTGQERREVPGAAHTACTVEMIDLQRRIDVAVLDEIQLIGDPSRGWAWTRALLGVPAAEVHVCGDGSAIELVRALCARTGDPFEVRNYERFTALEVYPRGLPNGYREVRPGDCVVAFSRREIYKIKAEVEAATPHKACVIYGALPPETRRQQARLFNDPGNGYSVMVASDAVGMGLNLNIARVIFNTMTKRQGPGAAPLPVTISMVKQIAGRAGRRSSQYAVGSVTTRAPKDVRRLQEALAAPPEALATPSAGLLPEFEHFEMLASRRPEEPFTALLAAFAEEALLEGHYFFCRQDSVLGAAALLTDVEGLSLRDTYAFCMAPASTTDLRIAASLLHFARRYATTEPCTLDIAAPTRVPVTAGEMRHLETAHQVVALWLWLSNRFDAEAFPGRPQAEALSERICEMLAQGLEAITAVGKTGRLPGAAADDSAEGVEGWGEGSASEEPEAAVEELRAPEEAEVAADESMLAAFQSEYEELLLARSAEEREQRGWERSEEGGGGRGNRGKHSKSRRRKQRSGKAELVLSVEAAAGRASQQEVEAACA